VTPWKHSESTVHKWGGKPQDYIEIHNWLDETKQYTGNWTHRAFRHHAAGVQWGIERFGHAIRNSDGKMVPTKMIIEGHITEDCGFVPTVQDWAKIIGANPEPWMLKVAKKSKHMLELVD